MVEAAELSHSLPLDLYQLLCRESTAFIITAKQQIDTSEAETSALESCNPQHTPTSNYLMSFLASARERLLAVVFFLRTSCTSSAVRLHKCKQVVTVRIFTSNLHNSQSLTSTPPHNSVVHTLCFHIGCSTQVSDTYRARERCCSAAFFARAVTASSCDCLRMHH